MALNETFDVTELMDNDFDIGRSLKVSLFTETMETIIQNLIPEVIQGNWDNLSYPLSEWQKSQLENLDKQGVSCMLKMWLIDQLNLKEGTFCNATWDNVYCWPPTPIGSVASRNCSEILELMNEPNADKIQGTATRVCLDDGTWLRGDWTNYTHCADSYEQHTLEREEAQNLVDVVHIIRIVGSILSFIGLAASLSIYYYFKCLRCDRVTMHVHLMMALMLRCVLFLIITQPYIIIQTGKLVNEDLACKIMLSVNLYAIVASVSWMFIEGHYIHGKLTNNFLDHKTPLEAYYVIGWIMPLGLIGVYATMMGKNDSEKCWKDYSERLELWVLLAPILLALLANCLFLIKIIRIVLKKLRRTNLSEIAQYCRAIKSTLVLFPLLGLHNLMFAYAPEGKFKKYFVVLNSFCCSVLGLFVAVLYCFVCRDVRNAFGREYARIVSRRRACDIQSNSFRSISVNVDLY